MKIIVWGIIFFIGLSVFYSCIVAGRADRRCDELEERNLIKDKF